MLHVFIKYFRIDTVAGQSSAVLFRGEAEVQYRRPRTPN